MAIPVLYSTPEEAVLAASASISFEAKRHDDAIEIAADVDLEQEAKDQLARIASELPEQWPGA